MGPGEIFQTLFGTPPAQAQLATALGQGPGQAGSPQGPQPLAGQNASAGGPPGQPQAPPQPQAYQSPPDLVQAYMALSQQNQAKQDFWGGLAGVAQGLHPGRVTPGMVKSITGTQQDPGTMFQNLMQIQQYQQQNQALQAYRQGVPGILKGMGLSDDEVKAYTPLAQADPSFATKVAENKLGVGGSPAWMAQQRAEAALSKAGQPIPWTPGDPVSYNAYNLSKAQADEAHAKNLQDFKDSGVEDFSTVDQKFTKNEDTVGVLLKNMPATMSALQAPDFLTTGKLPGYLPGGGPYGQDVKNAANAMNTLKAELSSEGLRNVKNVRNVREFNTLGSALTNALDASNSPEQVQTALENIQKGFASGHAQAFAVAGKEVPYSYKGLVDPRYLTRGGPYDTGATQEEAPADSGGGGGGPQQSGGGSGAAPPVPGAKKAADGNWYVPDPARPGKYLRVE